MVKTDIEITVNSVKEAHDKINEIALTKGKLNRFNETEYSKVPLEEKIKPHILIADKERTSAFENRGYYIFVYPFGNQNLHSTKEFYNINIFNGN